VVEVAVGDFVVWISSCVFYANLRSVH